MTRRKPQSPKALIDPAADLDPLSQRIAIGLAKIGVALKTRSWKEAWERKITPTQGQILSFLRFRPGQSARLSEIAEGVAVTLPTASDAVRTLQVKQLVRKVRSSIDARSVTVTLSAKGRLEADRAAEWPDFLAAATESLPPADQENLLKHMIGIMRTLQERDEIPPSRMCVTCVHFHPNSRGDRRASHYCQALDVAFGNESLRLDCQLHEAAPDDLQYRHWKAIASEPQSTAVKSKRQPDEYFRLKEHYERLATIDPVTELFNRGGWIDMAERICQRAAHSGYELGVVLIELRKLKRLAEQRGGTTANLALRHVADLLRRTFRPMDLLGRWAGEEFIVLLSAEGPMSQIAERIKQAVESHPFQPSPSGPAVPLQAAISCRTFTPKGDTVAQLQDTIARADRQVSRGRKPRPSRASRSSPHT